MFTTCLITGAIGFGIGFVLGILIILCCVANGHVSRKHNGYNGKIEKINFKSEYNVQSSSSVDGSSALGGFQKQ